MNIDSQRMTVYFVIEVMLSERVRERDEEREERERERGSGVATCGPIRA